jgi:hypothetical protein
MEVKFCACGCGMPLAAGTNRDYKRGHKTNPIGPGRPENGDTDQDIYADITGDDREEYEFYGDAITLEQAAASVADDPQPFEQAKERPPAREFKITKRIRDDVEGKIAFMFTVTGSMASMIDPVCGGAFLANADQVASKMTPIICKSPEAVQWFRKSSSFMLYLDLLVACWPIFTAIYAHHIGKTVTNITDATMPPQPDMSQYAA